MDQLLMEDPFLTVAEVAEVLKLNPETVRNWINRGELPAIHVGPRIRVKRSDFNRLIEQGYSDKPSATGEGTGTTADGFWATKPPGFSRVRA